MEDIKILFNPKQKHLDEIAEWIIDNIEIPIKSSGNWDCITDAYNNKNLVIATYKSKTVGFYAFSNYDSAISINVAEVNSNFRRKGIARILLEVIIQKYEKDIYALHLFCAPESSQKIWKKLGFKYFPNNSDNNRSTRIEMYRIIKPFLKPKKNNSQTENEIIEIWNNESYKTKNDEPDWIWNLKIIKKNKNFRETNCAFWTL